MRTSIFACLLLSSVTLAVSCSDDPQEDDHHGDEHAGAGSGGAGADDHEGGNVECQELGSFCHEPGELDEAAQECHEVMHEAKAGCEDRLDECREICQAVIDANAGGAGGIGAGGAAAGGGAAGGEAGAGGGG